jgi:hypothetical protein
VEGSCEHGNEPSGSIKCWEVLEWLLKPTSIAEVNALSSTATSSIHLNGVMRN